MTINPKDIIKPRKQEKIIMKQTPNYTITNHLDTPAPDWMAGILRGDKRYCVRGQDITDGITQVVLDYYIDDDDKTNYCIAIDHEHDGKKVTINFGSETIIQETDTTIYLDSPTPEEIIADGERMMMQTKRNR